MAGYNGSGVYQIRYSFVQDAGNGIKILASRQDQQWTDMVGGFNNCLTRDAQGKPTANFDFNSFKGLNLATATLPGDAVPLLQAQGLANAAAVLAQNEWVIDSHTPTFVANNQYKFTGIDLTATYKVGRRVKITHNTGASTLYASITAVAFGADTTVTIDSTLLVSTVTAVAYSTQDPAFWSMPYRTFVGVHIASGGGNLTTGTTYVIGAAAAPFAASVVVGDLMSEYNSGTGTFTAKYAGLYEVDCRITLQCTGVTVTSTGSLSVFVNGGQIPVDTQAGPMVIPGTGVTVTPLLIWVQLNAGDALQVKTGLTAGFSAGTVAAATNAGHQLRILRIR